MKLGRAAHIRQALITFKPEQYQSSQPINLGIILKLHAIFRPISNQAQRLKYRYIFEEDVAHKRYPCLDVRNLAL